MNLQEAESYIQEVTKPIKGNYGNPLSAARLWETSGLDGLILEPPSHSGKTEEVAREVYHRLAARLIASQLHEPRRIALRKGISGAFACEILLLVAIPPLALIIAATFPGKAAWLTPLIFLVLFLSIPAGLLAYANGLVNSAPHQMRSASITKAKEEALGAVKRCFFRVFPDETPEDLADIWRHTWFTNEGRPLSSELVETDATSLVALEFANDWQSIASALRFAAVTCLAGPCLLPVLLVLLLRNSENYGRLRAMELDRRQAVEGSTLVAAGGVLWAKQQEQARMQQVSESIRDLTPLFELGLTTGVLAARGDGFAPSAGLPFHLSLKDLQNHLVVFGGTGAGKTSGVLRPLAHQVASTQNVGLVVMDGKAALPAELASLPGMKLIDPKTNSFSLVAGLSPSDLVDTLVDVLAGQNESEPYWTNAAAGLLRRSAVLAQRAGGSWWTLEGIGKIATSEDSLKNVMESITFEEFQSDPVLAEAFHFFAYEWKEMDKKPQSSIVSHAMNWISSITAHPDLLNWAKTGEGQDSFDLLAPLQGGRLGFLIPAHRYGRAGAVVTALLKARFYAKIRERAERQLQEFETPIVFLIDEAQEVATKDDATMLAIGRSLGLAMIAATQTIEGVEEKLGDKTASKWLAVFGNALALTGRSHRTDEFMAKRAGSVWKATVRSVPGVSVKDAIVTSLFSGSVAVTRRQTLMRPFAVPRPSPVTPFTERARHSAQGQSPINPDPRYQREVDEGLHSSVEPSPLVFSEEMSSLLAEPNLALLVAIRGRVPRRDIIRLDPKY